MNPIEDSRVKQDGQAFIATCACNCTTRFSSKASALRMLERGSCRQCKKDYRSVKDADYEIYKREDGKWCCTCSGCNKEQAYTRKDHAKQSSLSGWQCKGCASANRKYSRNAHVGSQRRVFRCFQQSARNRGIEWSLSEEQAFSIYTGRCALTGWDIDLGCGASNKRTASLDRIDNTKGYAPDNIQWVHTMVNMCRNKYSLADFLAMCQAVEKYSQGK